MRAAEPCVVGHEISRMGPPVRGLAHKPPHAEKYNEDSGRESFSGSSVLRTVGFERCYTGVFVIASAQRRALTKALSMLAGHPVSVQAPATSRLEIGLR